MASTIPILRAAGAATLTAALLVACGGDSNTGPDDEQPVITISGVEDGGSYEAPVTIDIDVEPGSYTARLNGEFFLSGGTVTQPGAYTLVVTGRNGLATAQSEIDFTLVGGGTGDVLIVRILDLRLGTVGAPGDAILVTDSSSAGMTHALIDAGARTIGTSEDQGYVRTRLSQLGVDTLRFMQLTHAHFDHYAGMDEILRSAIHVRSFVYNGQVRTASSYLALLDTANARADTVAALSQLRTLELGGGSVPTVVTMVPPLETYLDTATNDGAELNEGSIGTLIEHGGFRMYFTGDGELAANTRWRLSYAALTGGVDILKVGHHGANDATQTEWLTHSSFEVAAISANGRTHPLNGALARIQQVSSVIYCTNVHGEIRITVDESGFYTVQVEKNAGAPCTAGSEATT